ncbi:MAG: hypothetical protein LBI84_01890, partial [Propionibacteriaceae bacterium]|nr:hypothetical protein [Propionibacteriaceae bacterium]
MRDQKLTSEDAVMKQGADWQSGRMLVEVSEGLIGHIAVAEWIVPGLVDSKYCSSTGGKIKNHGINSPGFHRRISGERR